MNTSLPFQSYSGYENVDWYFKGGAASIYFSLWQGHYLPWAKEVPLIIWLQGGPGAPSQFGCFNEVGPLYIQGNRGNFTVLQNPWTWTFWGHLMCVDQPAGVGFSYNNDTKKVDNTDDAANHFINFLSNFFKNNPSLGLIKNPLYIAGESYAGHYIPAIAEKIKTNSSLDWNLKGVMIGDGWIDPLTQNNNYDSYLNSVGVVSNEWRDTTSFMQNQAIIRIMRGDYKQASNYTNFIIADDNITQKYYNGMNVLNYKQYDNDEDLYVNDNYWHFLQDNKKQLGIPEGINYNPNNLEMYYAFCQDLSRSYKKSLEKILNLGVQTLLYNGQNDFIVNTAAVLNYLNGLDWVFNKEWRDKKKKMWSEYSGENLGWYKTHRNFNFVLVRNAGHLVPTDQPRSAFLMLGKFFQNTWDRDY